MASREDRGHTQNGDQGRPIVLRLRVLVLYQAHQMPWLDRARIGKRGMLEEPGLLQEPIGQLQERYLVPHLARLPASSARENPLLKDRSLPSDP